MDSQVLDLFAIFFLQNISDKLGNKENKFGAKKTPVVRKKLDSVGLKKNSKQGSNFVSSRCKNWAPGVSRNENNFSFRDENGQNKKNSIEGGAIAEWSEALLVRENKRKTKKMTGLPPGLGKKQPL